MADIEKVKKGCSCCQVDENEDLEHCKQCPYNEISLIVQECRSQLSRDALEVIEKLESILGVHQTADGITFISTGDAHQGETRGILLGKAYMHEHLMKELIYSGLMTDEIRKIFNDAKNI